MFFRLHPICACVAVTAALTQLAYSQGPLQPPGGPAPTMKSLDELDAKLNEANARLATVDAKQNDASAKLEKRTPISRLPFAISTPGSYYVTSNLTGVANQNGISIDVSNVTIDLMGHTLNGAPGPQTGIIGSSSANNITIRNGTVVGWGARGVSIEGTRVRVERVTATGNGTAGIFAGEGAVVVDCIAAENSAEGIILGRGGIVYRCHARFNGSIGIRAGGDSLVSHCVASENQAVGILLPTNAIAQGCSSTYNRSHNIQANSSALVARCTANFGDADGINVGPECLVLENVCRGNIGAGIRAADERNRIESNTVGGNTFGIRVELNMTNNLVVKNNASRNGTNYSIAPGNRVGLLVTPAANGTFISGNTGGTSITDPWANFAY